MHDALVLKSDNKLKRPIYIRKNQTVHTQLVGEKIAIEFVVPNNTKLSVMIYDTRLPMMQADAADATLRPKT